MQFMLFDIFNLLLPGLSKNLNFFIEFDLF
jgi:hypothetical protein